jgi:signal transduction histidine kinase
MSSHAVTTQNVSHQSASAWPGRLANSRLLTTARTYGYAAAIAALTIAVFLALPEARPSTDPIYAPLSLAMVSGLLLTIRLAPNRPGAALVLLPAMAMDARFGLASLPALAYAALLVNLVRGLRGPRVISSTGHAVLAFAGAHVAAQLLDLPAPDWLVFAVVFASLRALLWQVDARLDGSPPQAREEQPDLLLSIPLAPVGLLPMIAGERLGDGALLLASAALLALLFVVRESANLATARAEMEAERDRLARANALQDEMIYMITHELRNPLTLVMSYAQMSRRAAQDENYTHIPTYIAHVEKAGRSIQRLMENLLQLSRLERSDALPAAEPVEVDLLINQVIGDLAPLARQKQQSLTAGSSEGLDPALVVPMLLRDALSNLVSNAVKYTPEGGEICVWAERGTQPRSVVVSVRDNGIGLSKDDQARLFTKFFRSTDARVQRERGTGLGLALTHALVTRSGGTITVESEPERGTTFRLTLPTAAT